MELPKDFDERCALLRQEFLNLAHQGIERRPDLFNAWDKFCHNPSRIVEMDVTLSFTQDQFRAELDRTENEYIAFSNNVLTVAWNLADDKFRELRDSIKRDLKGLQLAIVITSRERPSDPQPGSSWSIGLNDRRFLQSLRIAADEPIVEPQTNS